MSFILGMGLGALLAIGFSLLSMTSMQDDMDDNIDNNTDFR